MITPRKTYNANRLYEKDPDAKRPIASITKLMALYVIFGELDKLSSGMSYKQKSLCSLTKLNFIPSEIGSLLNMNYQSVTNMRSRLAKRLFGENCQTIDFDKKIHSIC